MRCVTFTYRRPVCNYRDLRGKTNLFNNKSTTCCNDKEKYRVSCLHNEKMIILWLLSSQNRYKWPINVVIMCNFRTWKGQIDHLCLLYNLKHPWCQSSIITIKEETFNCFPGRKFNYGWAQQVSTHISVCVCVWMFLF